MSEAAVSVSGSTSNARCNGCGRRDVVTRTFRCLWPDQRITVERHCHLCRLTWHRQLRALGAELQEIAEPETNADELGRR